MTEEQVKHYLCRAYRAKEMIESLQEELDRLQELADYAEEVYAPHGRSDSLMARIIEKEQRLKARIKEYLEAAEQVQEVIEGLENRNYKAILRMRYLNFKAWDEIARTLHFSSVWAYHLHKRALAEVGEVIERMEKQTLSAL